MTSSESSTISNTACNKKAPLLLISSELLPEQQLSSQQREIQDYEFLITHKTSTINNNIKNKKEYVICLEKQIDGLPGGLNYSYYTFNWKGMEIFLKHLKEDAKLSNNSMFLDVGSGRGHTVFCVANFLKPVMSYGIEGDNVRYMVLLFFFYSCSSIYFSFTIRCLKT
jgi:hypothetical protein